MRKTYTVISSYVDIGIREMQPDIDFKLFRNITEVELTLTHTPVKTDIFYFSRDVLGDAINFSLSSLLTIVTNPYFTTERIVYITDQEYKEQLAIEHIQKSIDTKIEVVRGVLSAEFVTSLVTGNLRQDEVTPEKLVRIRTKRSHFVNVELSKNTHELNQEYLTDEQMLGGIPSEEIQPIMTGMHEGKAKMINICGLRCVERSAFSFMLAQYCSVLGKSIIIESDFEYLRTSDMVERSGLEIMKIYVDEFLSRADEIIPLIQQTKARFIAFISTDGNKYDYNFLLQLIYSTIGNYCQYIIVESNLEEVNAYQDYIVVFPNRVVDIVETIHKLNISVTDNTRFAAVDMNTIRELSVHNHQAVLEIIREILGSKVEAPVGFFTIQSLILGGQAYDLQMYVS